MSIDLSQFYQIFFEEAAEQVAALGYDERFRRLWDLYLSYCEGEGRRDSGGGSCGGDLILNC